MKKCLLIFLVAALSFNYYSHAQIEGCDGSRYIDDIFTEIKVTQGLKYGEGETINGNLQELFLDVYEPENDELDRRPVIVLAFGGSFISGAREDIQFLCEAYVRKGYVAVSIDYRLYDGPPFPIPTEEQMKTVVIKSVSDMKAAIRYMREDADTDNIFRIDPNFVFVGGISAGSITAFHTAVIDENDEFPEDISTILADNGGLEGNTSDNYEYSSDVQGVVNFSGGLNDASWIDENDPPFVSIHDDMDVVVPYGNGFASIFSIPIVYMEGSKTCQEVGDSIGLSNQLKTIEGSFGHVSYFSNSTEVAESVDYTANFLAEILCVGTHTEDTLNELESIEVYPNPTSGLITISNETNIDVDVELLDVFGRKLNSYTGTNTIDMSDYSNGMYLLSIRNQEIETLKTIKLVIEK